MKKFSESYRNFFQVSQSLLVVRPNHFQIGVLRHSDAVRRQRNVLVRMDKSRINGIFLEFTDWEA
jgi:hypothetical protein